MNKKISVVVTALVVGLGVNSYGQTNKFVQKSLQAMSGGVPSAFSTVAPLSVRSVNMLGDRIAHVELSLANTAYISSGELFKRVSASRVLDNVKPAEARLLEAKFSQLDAVAVAQPKRGYAAAFRSMAPAATAEVLTNPNVSAMTELLDVQQYMQLNGNEFPEIYSVLPGGWLTATPCMDSIEGNRAFLGVVSILVKAQTGEVSPAVVEQLVALHAQARNIPSAQDVAAQLQEWRKANRSADAPKLPTNTEGLSLRHNPETLWLTTEIRLWQLTPDADVPEIIRTANVVL